VSAGVKTDTQSSPAKPSRILWLAVAIALSAIGGAFWLNQKAAVQTQRANDRKVKETLHLDTFVLNLADPGQRSYARVGIDLGLSRPMGKRDNAPALGPVRDTIIEVLGQAKAEDLVTPQGKEKLKGDLLHALQERAPGLGIEDVYFTEFLIQR
jgi:flagellar protein FliL